MRERKGKEQLGHFCKRALLHEGWAEEVDGWEPERDLEKAKKRESWA